MQEFRYFVIVEKDGEIQRLNDAMFTSDDVLNCTLNYPNCVRMGLEQRFLWLLAKWNTEQTHKQIRYFYGPL